MYLHPWEKKCYLTREKITVAICHCCLHKIITFYFLQQKNISMVISLVLEQIEHYNWLLGKYEISLQVLL